MLSTSFGRSGDQEFEVQIDTGTILAEGEGMSVVEQAVNLAAHLHVSEPHLRPVSRLEYGHEAISDALAASRYDGWLSVEMQQTDNWRKNIEEAALLINAAYSKVGE